MVALHVRVITFTLFEEAAIDDVIAVKEADAETTGQGVRPFGSSCMTTSEKIFFCLVEKIPDLAFLPSDTDSKQTNELAKSMQSGKFYYVQGMILVCVNDAKKHGTVSPSTLLDIREGKKVEKEAVVRTTFDAHHRLQAKCMIENEGEEYKWAREELQIIRTLRYDGLVILPA